MAEIHATLIDKLTGATTSDDGAHLILRGTSGGAEVHFAIPFDEVLSLLSIVSVEAGKAQQKRTGEKNAVHTFNTDWFEIGKSDTNHFVFSFQIAPGQKLRFMLPLGMERNFLEVLRGALEGVARADRNVQ